MFIGLISTPSILLNVSLYLTEFLPGPHPKSNAILSFVFGIKLKRFS